jgi:hypothetical protein
VFISSCCLLPTWVYHTWLLCSRPGHSFILHYTVSICLHIYLPSYLYAHMDTQASPRNEYVLTVHGNGGTKCLLLFFCWCRRWYLAVRCWFPICTHGDVILTSPILMTGRLRPRETDWLGPGGIQIPQLNGLKVRLTNSVIRSSADAVMYQALRTWESGASGC